MAFPPIFDNVWDLTQPPDTQLLNQGAADFRKFRDDVMQRMSLMAGILANRPTPETVNATWGGVGYGLLYFTTDTNQVFQWNGAAWVDITANVGPNPKEVASVILTAQVAAIAPTLLYAVPVAGAGMYRISAEILITAVGTGTTAANIGYNNGVAAQLGIVAINNTILGNEPFLQNVPNVFSFYSAASQNINYSVTGFGGMGTYSLSLKLEYLG